MARSKRQTTPGERNQSPAMTSTRTVHIVVSPILLALATLLAVDNWRTGMSWDASGPQAGYFPSTCRSFSAPLRFTVLSERLHRTGDRAFRHA